MKRQFSCFFLLFTYPLKDLFFKGALDLLACIVTSKLTPIYSEIIVCLGLGHCRGYLRLRFRGTGLWALDTVKGILKYVSGVETDLGNV